MLLWPIPPPGSCPVGQRPAGADVSPGSFFLLLLLCEACWSALLGQGLPSLPHRDRQQEPQRAAEPRAAWGELCCDFSVSSCHFPLVPPASPGRQTEQVHSHSSERSPKSLLWVRVSAEWALGLPLWNRRGRVGRAGSRALPPVMAWSAVQQGPRDRCTRCPPTSVALGAQSGDFPWPPAATLSFQWKIQYFLSSTLSR